jgi:hypothetical protein
MEIPQNFNDYAIIIQDIPEKIFSTFKKPLCAATSPSKESNAETNRKIEPLA